MSMELRLLHPRIPSAKTTASSSPKLLKSREIVSKVLFVVKALLILFQPSKSMLLPLIVSIETVWLCSISLAICSAPSCVMPQSPMSRFIIAVPVVSKIASTSIPTPSSFNLFPCNLKESNESDISRFSRCSERDSNLTYLRDLS